MKCFFMCLVVLSVLGSVAAQQPQPASSLNLAGQVDIARLVDLAAQRLRLHVEYDATALKAAGQVTVRVDSGLNDEELWGLMNRALVAHGLVTVRVTGERSYAVVKIADAASIASDATRPGEPQAGYRVATVRARHRPAKELAEAVSRVLSKTGGTAVVLKDGVDGVIVLSDVAARVEQAAALIEQIDVMPTQAVMEEIRLKNYTGEQIAALAAAVVQKREAISGEKCAGEVVASPDGGSVFVVCDARALPQWKALVADLDLHAKAETAVYPTGSLPSKEIGALIERSVKADAGDRWNLVVDDLAGSLIITATPGVHERVRSILDRMAAAASGAQRPVRSFVIRNRPVKEIQSVLEQLAQTGVLATEETAAVGESQPWPPERPASGTRVGGKQAPVDLPASSARPPIETGADRRSRESGLSLSADEGTNTLIAMGEPRLLSQVETLLRTLDVRQPQVMLEVLIISLSESQTFDLGMELEKLTGGDTRTRLSSLFGLSSRDGAGGVNAGSGLGFTGVVLNPGDFSIVVRALETLNRGRSLSMPRLLVTNNQQGTLDSVLEQPFASTNASNTVTTTSFGGVKPAGTQITLKPQIAGGGEGDHLLLDYSVSLSAFVGAAASASLPPPRQENKLQSMASLPDGHTVVMGGIELNTDGKATNQIPGLGSIPVLGEAFKSRSNNASRSRFYVFIRANILRARGFEELKYVSQVSLEGVGMDDGWPVSEPLVIR